MNTNHTVELTVEEETRRGALIAEVLSLRKRHNPDGSGESRFVTSHGTKSDLGLFRTIQRLVLDGE